MSDTAKGKQQDNSALQPENQLASQAAAWVRANAEAISDRRAWIEANGTPLADIQVLRGL